MTHEFTKENWLPSTENNVMLLVTANPLLVEKPLIQVYFYPDNTNNTIAVLTEMKQIHYSQAANIITIISTQPFDGYVVLK